MKPVNSSLENTLQYTKLHSTKKSVGHGWYNSEFLMNEMRGELEENNTY